MRIPEHVHGLLLRLCVSARVAHRNALDINLWSMREDLIGECRDIDARIGLAGDVKAVGPQLRELGPEEVLHSRPVRLRRRHICVGAVAASLHGRAIGVAHTTGTLQDQQVGLLRPRIRIPHEAACGVHEQRALLLQHAEYRAAARTTIQPEHYGQGPGICDLGLGEPVVEHGPRLLRRGVQESGPLRSGRPAIARQVWHSIFIGSRPDSTSEKH
mmetsp:Transcript_114800/g.245055  ORF Transcript_114800/g.245055 Transcript_114800/m.245055 type:complete len:215 (+) Transcript_114800:1060-1704(+)